MKTFFAFVFTLLATLAALPAAQFKIGAHTFTVPDGFEVALVAGTNLVPRPIEADFDDQGRLYVTDSSGSNDKVDKQLQEKPHRVVRLEDSDGDGRFDKSTVFAEKLMFPEGAMWFEGSLYVSAPPSIWKLTDTNDDGVADVRVEWFQGKTLGGCANDLHGPYAGPDGWIYWCKGGFVKQTNTLWNGKQFISRASHIFRARPDGTGLDVVLTGGMDNPVGVAFTPEGDRILGGTFFQHPEAGKRDGLIHAIYGGVYGKIHDPIEEHKRTGDVLPMMTHLGPAAACSVTRYQSRAFGDDHRDNLFACSFNLRKITRHIVEPNGATLKTRDEDFLVSDNTDFHPTDVFEDADGSLLIIDTGGWYKLCCPTSQLQKPDVLGGIYRVRRKGTPKIADPRGLKLAWDAPIPELVLRLRDERFAVRERAIRELGRNGAEAIPALASVISRIYPGGLIKDVFDQQRIKALLAEARRNAIWALTRIDLPTARETVHHALSDADESVRLAALNSISLWRDSKALPQMLEALNHSSFRVRRAAAEVIGRIGDKTSVPSLLRAAASANDRVLEHSIIYALIEINDPAATRVELKSESAQTKRATLIALDQMDNGDLKSGEVTPLLASSDALLRQTASWIVSRHSDWADALAGFFNERLRAVNLSSADHAELQKQLGQFVKHESVQRIIGEAVEDSSVPKSNRIDALRVMAGTQFKTSPSAWPKAVEPLLRSEDRDLQRAAVLAARALPQHSAELTAALVELGRTTTLPNDIRLNGFAATRGLSSVGPHFPFVRSQLADTNSIATRLLAASVLASVKLNDEEREEVARAIVTVGPLELPKLLSVFDRATNEALGLKLIDCLEQSRAAGALRRETLKPHLTNFPTIVQHRANQFLASLNTDAVKERAHLDELFASCKGGDIRRGQAIFNSTKTACVSCHAIGYVGGKVGPDLTRIGQVRTERDLLEAIVYPSASFVRSYEPMIVATKSGEEYSGVLRKDADDEVVLATGPDTEQRIARSDIGEMRSGTVSVMPSGLADQLNKQEIADLLAFLKASR